MSMATQSLGVQIYNLPPTQRKEVRDLEKVSLKLAKTKCSKVFNTTCLTENLLPMYSNIKLHDRAATNELFTLRYRRQLVQRELEKATSSISELERDVAERTTSIKETMDHEVLKPILETIKTNVDNENIETRLKMTRKLSKLYRAPIILPDNEQDAFINLSNYTLTENEKSLLNLGLNCHVQSPVDKYKKKVELEILYENLLDLQKNNIVEISNDLRDQLRAEGSRYQGNSNSKVLTTELK